MSQQLAVSARVGPVPGLDPGTGCLSDTRTERSRGYVLFEKVPMSLAYGITLIAIGTGGALELSGSGSSFAQPTGSRAVFAVVQGEQAETEQVRSAPELIGEIRAAFGLSVSQLARALQVERQTIYLWLDPDQPPRIQTRNRERLIEIHGFATEWNRLCAAPARKWLDHAVAGGESLLDLLEGDALDGEALHAAMQAVAAKANKELSARKGGSLAQKLRQKGFHAPAESAVTGTLARYSGTVVSSED